MFVANFVTSSPLPLCSLKLICVLYPKIMQWMLQTSIFHRVFQWFLAPLFFKNIVRACFAKKYLLSFQFYSQCFSTSLVFTVYFHVVQTFFDFFGQIYQITLFFWMGINMSLFWDFHSVLFTFFDVFLDDLFVIEGCFFKEADSAVFSLFFSLNCNLLLVVLSFYWRQKDILKYEKVYLMSESLLWKVRHFKEKSRFSPDCRRRRLVRSLRLTTFMMQTFWKHTFVQVFIARSRYANKIVSDFWRIYCFKMNTGMEVEFKHTLEHEFF